MPYAAADALAQVQRAIGKHLDANPVDAYERSLEDDFLPYMPEPSDAEKKVWFKTLVRLRAEERRHQNYVNIISEIT